MPPAATRACPHCGEELLSKALQCRRCRKWMPGVVDAAAVPTAARSAAGEAAESAPGGAFRAAPSIEARAGGEPRPSNAQPSAHFVLLSLLTLGLYELYWFWRNWRDLRDTFGVEVSPGWRTAGLLVPVLNVYLVYDHVRLVHEQAEAHGVAPSFRPAAAAASFFLIALAGNLTLLWVVSLLNVLPLVPVQETLNRLWAEVQPAAPMRDRMSVHERMALVAGAAMTGGALLATFG